MPIRASTINQTKHLLEEIKVSKVGSECGIHVKNFNDVAVDDIIEGFWEQTTPLL